MIDTGMTSRGWIRCATCQSSEYFSPTLDIFDADAFTIVERTRALESIPYKPAILSGANLFGARGVGLPLYARMIPDRERDEWVRLEIESNPLPICTRPQVLRSARRT
jgi:hypothetical protein